MIKVAIVDDDETMLEQARACIEGIDDLPEDVDIRTFTSAEKFLSSIGPEDIYHVLFTDIHMDGMDGIELGAIIQAVSYTHLYIFRNLCIRKLQGFIIRQLIVLSGIYEQW